MSLFAYHFYYHIICLPVSLAQFFKISEAREQLRDTIVSWFTTNRISKSCFPNPIFHYVGVSTASDILSLTYFRHSDLETISLHF